MTKSLLQKTIAKECRNDAQKNISENLPSTLVVVYDLMFFQISNSFSSAILLSIAKKMYSMAIEVSRWIDPENRITSSHNWKYFIKQVD